MISFNVGRSNTKKTIIHGLRIAFLISATLTSHQLLAASIQVKAIFSPNHDAPNKNFFKNITPNGGYCADFPRFCKDSNTFSLTIPNALTSAHPIEAYHKDPRQGALVQAPANWKEVRVTSAQGDTKTLKLRITAVGARNDLFGITQTEAWELNWVNAPKPCGTTGWSAGNKYQHQFMWLTPIRAECGIRAKNKIQKLRFDRINFAYELITPDPLSMATGFYNGSIDYTIGPNKDFDFGDVLIPDDPILTINFNLEVQHLLKVQFPAGSERLTLNPDGGWQQWLHRGRRPEKLTANQTFQVWSSSAFNMKLQCQHPVGDHCGIQNDAGHLVPVETRVTLPPGLVDNANKPVNRHLLSKSDPVIFHPTFYVDNSRAALHFEVGRESVKQMTDHAGSRYSGNVTVIWDAQIK